MLQNLPGGYEKLAGFEQRFVDALLARTGMEKRMAATYQANHRAYLRAVTQRSTHRR